MGNLISGDVFGQAHLGVQVHALVFTCSFSAEGNFYTFVCISVQQSVKHFHLRQKHTQKC